jgi:fermentation-respiration switch protein FrsA (DUF1100 family)
MLKFIFFPLAVYLVFILFLYQVQRQLIYFPSHRYTTPAAAGVPEMQEIHLTTEDGLKLIAWYRPPTKSDLPTVVHFHGNAGDIGHRGMIVKPFLNEGYGVLLLTYRGYSGNPGEPSEKGLYEDARAAMQFLKQKGVLGRCIVLYGHSIGAGVAVQMAIEFQVGALILQSPFTSLRDVGQYHYPILPVSWLIKEEFDSLKKAHKINVPVFILHGEEDDIIPKKFALQLYEAFPTTKEIEMVPGRGHNDLFDSDSLVSFIKRYVKC